MITDVYAPGANKYGLDIYNDDNILTDINGDANIKLDEGEWRGHRIVYKKYIKVINYSLGSAPDVGKNYITGNSCKNGNLLFLKDAVVVKAAGNDASYISNIKEGMRGFDDYAWANDKDIAPRLLLVGAIDNDGNLAYYSNMPGDNPLIANKFLLANDYSPYYDITINDNLSVSSGIGTSYAAPRVTAYAAILRQKFPNLDATQSANILLDTASHESLKCYPNCPSSKYGRGVTNLPRALAPVGSLR